MTRKTNLLANYASQLYVTLMGVVVVPLFLRYVGAEAYGLGIYGALPFWRQPRVLRCEIPPQLVLQNANLEE